MKILFSSLFLVLHLFAQSSAWKISDDSNHTIYIGGTIHLLRSSDYPLPQEFDEAYAKADYIVFETDLSLVHSQNMQRMLAQKMELPAGQNLSGKLSPKTYSQLKEYVESQGYGVKKFDRLQPWAVMLILTQLKLSQIGIDQNGVDSYYSERSLHDSLPQRYLESVEKQIGIITNIGEGEEDAVILQTLRDMKEFPSMMAWMVADWRVGKTDRLERELVLEMKEESPKMYSRVLVERNNAWMPQLIKMLHEEKRGFVLVGAMHLLGNEGLLEQFRRKGYKIEAVENGR